jgi:hypothetical protein
MRGPCSESAILGRVPSSSAWRVILVIVGESLMVSDFEMTLQRSSRRSPRPACVDVGQATCAEVARVLTTQAAKSGSLQLLFGAVPRTAPAIQDGLRMSKPLHVLRQAAIGRFWLEARCAADDRS